jgi:transcription elongation GreA/GreB family factor
MAAVGMGTPAADVKRELVAGLRAALEGELANMRRAAADARAAATHEEAKPENDKDTRALEASYLAGAQAARVRELEASLKALEQLVLLELEGKPIQATALVTLEDEDGARTTFWLAPLGGGTSVTTSAGPTQVLTPQSPLGKQLLGRTEGEVVEMRAKAGPRVRELTIVSVR